MAGDRTAATASSRIWDATQILSLHPFARTTPALVYAVAFSPDSQTLLTGTADKIARLWDVQSGEKHRAGRVSPAVVNSAGVQPRRKPHPHRAATTACASFTETVAKRDRDAWKSRTCSKSASSA